MSEGSFQHKQQTMKLTVYEIAGDALVEANVDVDSDAWIGDGKPRWVKIVSDSCEGLRTQLERFGVDPSILTACAGLEPQPRVIALSTQLFISFPVLLSAEGGSSFVHMVCLPSTVITVQSQETHPLEKTLAAVQDRSRALEGSGTAFGLHLIDALGDDWAAAYFRLRTDVDSVVQQLDDDPSEVDAGDVLALKQRVLGLADLLENHLYCLTLLRQSQSVAQDVAAVGDQIRDMTTDVERLMAVVARLEDRIRDVRQHFLNFQQEKMNRRLNILAVLSAVYLPSTLIAGLYGMNFSNIPMIGFAYGYVFVLAVMIALVLGQIWFFWRRGWFD